MAAVNLNEIGEFIAATNAVSKAFGRRVAEQVFDYIKEALASGQEVSIDKFGKFVPKQQAERLGRNPRDGSVLTIPARMAVKFKPQKSLREEVNQQEVA